MSVPSWPSSVRMEAVRNMTPDSTDWHMWAYMKMDEVCKAYLDHLENGGPEMDLTKVLILMTIEAPDYTRKLYQNWKTVRSAVHILRVHILT